MSNIFYFRFNTVTVEQAGEAHRCDLCQGIQCEVALVVSRWQLVLI